MIMTTYNKRLFFPVFILLIVMLIGGLYFAQHYLIDYLIAVPFAVLLYPLCFWVIKKDTESSIYSRQEKNGEMDRVREVLLP
jgi:predicted PurR-regulated permease PerM